MPSSVTSRTLLLRGALFCVAGILVRLFSGTLLGVYQGYVDTETTGQYGVLEGVLDVVDSILIPLGVALIASAYVVSALQGARRDESSHR